jgi:Skp family chaperone for outer membrane proteins
MQTYFSRGMTAMAAFGLALAVFAGSAQAQNDQGQLTVGTFEPQQVFQSFEGRQQMMQEMQRAQKKAQEAAQGGDQQAAMQARQQMQQKQQELMEDFRSRMEKAAADVAEEENVDLVAPEVTYAASEVEQRDLTKAITSKLNESVDASAQGQQGQGQMQGQQNQQGQGQGQGQGQSQGQPQGQGQGSQSR